MSGGASGGSEAVRSLLRVLRCRCASGAALAGLLASAASGVVHTTGDGSGNTSAPPDDPGWANVGVAGGNAAVYLGRGWVLTAWHVGERDLVLEGESYPAVPGSLIQLDHSETQVADLALYRLRIAPDLPQVTLSVDPPDPGDPVVMIGKGWTREAGLTQWTATWQETPPGVPVHAGYKWGAGKVMRWGRNVVTSAGEDVTTGPRTTRTFLTAFDDVGGIADEAQAVNGDSGGAVYLDRGGWELAGIMYAMDDEDFQPADTAVFGNLSLSAELSYYHDQIVGITSPPIQVLPPAPALALVAALLGSGWAALRPARRRLG